MTSRSGPGPLCSPGWLSRRLQSARRRAPASTHHGCRVRRREPLLRTAARRVDGDGPSHHALGAVTRARGHAARLCGRDVAAGTARRCPRTARRDGDHRDRSSVRPARVLVRAHGRAAHGRAAHGRARRVDHADDLAVRGQPRRAEGSRPDRRQRDGRRARRHPALAHGERHARRCVRLAGGVPVRGVRHGDRRDGCPGIRTRVTADDDPALSHAARVARADLRARALAASPRCDRCARLRVVHDVLVDDRLSCRPRRHRRPRRCSQSPHSIARADTTRACRQSAIRRSSRTIFIA